MLFAQVDWGNLCVGIAAIISAIGSAIAAVFAARAHNTSSKNAASIGRVELATNGMKNELVESARAGGLTEGEITGRAKEAAERNQLLESVKSGAMQALHAGETIGRAEAEKGRSNGV